VNGVFVDLDVGTACFVDFDFASPFFVDLTLALYVSETWSSLIFEGIHVGRRSAHLFLATRPLYFVGTDWQS
jgi:hypothetical protein